jgi:hypothetical protein
METARQTKKFVDIEDSSDLTINEFYQKYPAWMFTHVLIIVLRQSICSEKTAFGAKLVKGLQEEIAITWAKTKLGTICAKQQAIPQMV